MCYAFVKMTGKSVINRGRYHLNNFNLASYVTVLHLNVIFTYCQTEFICIDPVIFMVNSFVF